VDAESAYRQAALAFADDVSHELDPVIHEKYQSAIGYLLVL